MENILFRFMNWVKLLTRCLGNNSEFEFDKCALSAVTKVKWLPRYQREMVAMESKSVWCYGYCNYLVAVETYECWKDKLVASAKN